MIQETGADDGRNTYLALVPVLSDAGPNFSSPAWRIVEAGKKLQEIQNQVPEVAKEWKEPR